MRDFKKTISDLRNFNANYEANKLTNDAADAIEELLAESVTLRNQLPKWVSVEERLPEKDEMVIVYYSWTGQSGTEYKEVSLETLDEMRYCGNKLLGWMPLPEPPKEVE